MVESTCDNVEGFQRPPHHVVIRRPRNCAHLPPTRYAPGSYVCLVFTRFRANRDCLLKIYLLVKPGRTVSRELYWEKRVCIGLTSYG